MNKNHHEYKFLKLKALIKLEIKINIYKINTNQGN